MKVRRQSVQTRSETGTWRPVDRHREEECQSPTVCRGTEGRDCPSQPRIRACSRSFM